MSKIDEKLVVLGVSGGVDSSVSLALLKSQGFYPIGIFLKLWGKDNHCCNKDAERRARKVCNDLKVPFYAIDAREEFKQKVVDYFIDSYQNGQTPNPCVVCNREIKFKLLFDKLKELGGSFVATGHYARLEDGLIKKAIDSEKDQSYFLWQLKKRDLKRILFPIGDLTKEEVRKKAKQLKLETAEAPESQEVCFVESSLNSFLKSYIDLFSGNIEDKNGKKLGTHQGLPVYTIGQRKGIGLSGGPYYVLKKDQKRDVLVVTDNQDDLFKKEISFEVANFFIEPDYPMEVDAKIRYNADYKKGTLKENKFISFSSQKAVASGQSIVFYQGDKLLGGAIIK